MPDNQDPLVSIIITCFNLGPYLDDAVRSVRDQSFENWEIIVVDDGSDDEDTPTALRRLEEDSRPSTVRRQVRQGVSTARNNGIGQAKGRYVVCLDADDMLARDYLEKTVAVLEEDETRRFGFVTTSFREFGARDDAWEAADFDIPALLASNGVHVASMFRKDVFEEVGGYKVPPVSGYEDWELWMSIVERNYEWASIHEELFRYRIREESMLSGAKRNHAVLYGWLLDLHPALFAKYSRDVIVELSNQQRTLIDGSGYLTSQLADADAALTLVRAESERTGAELAQVRAREEELRARESEFLARLEVQTEALRAAERSLQQLQRSRTMRYTSSLRHAYAALRQHLGMRQPD